jgi:hypothetical protein
MKQPGLVTGDSGLAPCLLCGCSRGASGRGEARIRTDDVPKFKRDCQLCDSDSYLLYLLVKLNREKDKDYRDNGDSPGPNSEKLWARIVVIMDELKKRGWTFSASGQSVKDPEGNSHKVR